LPGGRHLAGDYDGGINRRHICNFGAVNFNIVPTAMFLSDGMPGSDIGVHHVETLQFVLRGVLDHGRGNAIVDDAVVVIYIGVFYDPGVSVDIMPTTFRDEIYPQVQVEEIRRGDEVGKLAFLNLEF